MHKPLQDSETDAQAYDVDYTHDHKQLLAATVILILAACLVSVVTAAIHHLNRPSRVTAARSPSRQPSKHQHLHPRTAYQASWDEDTAVRASSEALAAAYQRAMHQRQQQQQQHSRQDQQQQLGGKWTERPFRFRAPDIDEQDLRGSWTGSSTPVRDEEQYMTPPRPRHVVHEQQQQLRDQQEPYSFCKQSQQQQYPQHQQQADAGGWSPELLAQCAHSSPYITSVEALQRSPAYANHIHQVRGRRLNYETAETHKLRVYRALRAVDPVGFQKLFSRQDVKEYDEQPPSRLLTALECLISSSLTFSLLGIPWLLAPYSLWRVPAAMTWCCLHLCAAAAGCMSPCAWAVSLHSTYGEHLMLPTWPRMLVAIVLEAALLVFTAGAGLLVTFGCRLFTQQRQSFGERLMGLVPFREVVRPMHFNPLPPAGGANIGYVGSDDG